MTRRPSQPWSLAEAKAHLSSVVDLAIERGPQVITRRGQPAAVVISATQWKRTHRPKERLSTFLSRAPTKGLTLDLARRKDAPRPLDL